MNNVNPALELEKTPFYVVKSVIDWPAVKNKPRRAGISSFGLGGTNAHAILEEYLPDEPDNSSIDSVPFLALSAKTESSLEKIMNSVIELIHNDSSIRTSDACYTCNRYRKHYPYRAALLIHESGEKKDIRQIAFGNVNQNAEKASRVGLFIGDIHDTSTGSCKVNNGIADKYIEEIANIAKSCGYDDSVMDPCVANAFFRSYAVAKILSNTISLGYICGFGYGQVLADLLNSKISVNEALEIVFNGGPMPDPAINGMEKVDIAIILLESDKTVMPEAVHDNFEKFVLISDPGTLKNELAYIYGKLYVYGIKLSWDNINPDGSGKLVRLPAYQFNRRSFWL